MLGAHLGLRIDELGCVSFTAGVTCPARSPGQPGCRLFLLSKYFLIFSYIQSEPCSLFMSVHGTGVGAVSCSKQQSSALDSRKSRQRYISKATATPEVAGESRRLLVEKSFHLDPHSHLHLNARTTRFDGDSGGGSVFLSRISPFVLRICSIGARAKVFFSNSTLEFRGGPGKHSLGGKIPRAKFIHKSHPESHPKPKPTQTKPNHTRTQSRLSPAGPT